MKQILQSYRTGELWLADVPSPAPRRGGAVVRTGASLVSAGTERMITELAKKSLLGKARERPDRTTRARYARPAASKAPRSRRRSSTVPQALLDELSSQSWNRSETKGP